MSKSLSLLSIVSFAAAFFAVTAIFITAKSYSQLAVGSGLYVILIYFGYKMMPLFSSPLTLRATDVEINHETIAETETEESEIKGVDDEKKTEVTVTDIDKRAFLKIVGATGLSFFLMSLFGRRAEGLLFDNMVSKPATDDVVKTAPLPVSPTEGYTISEIDDGLVAYYGFMGPKGAWFIMKQDSNDGSFRYVKGDVDFPVNWEDRANLQYDYYANVFI
jgi:hypothetical protein